MEYPSLHAQTFEPMPMTKAQLRTAEDIRQRFSVLAQALDASLPAGPDKTATLRYLRTTAMWANVAITRHPDGAPRAD